MRNCETCLGKIEQDYPLIGRISKNTFVFREIFYYFEKFRRIFATDFGEIPRNYRNPLFLVPYME
jgi:hypothetical protein